METLKYSNYFFPNPNSNKDEKIFYSTNFSPDEFDPNKIVLVFNYGLVCNVAHWREQLPYFDSKGYQILTHDYRFHFGSSRDDDISECTFNNITLDMKNLLDHLNIERSIMIGHSMGVNITLEFAHQYPEMLESMILISGTVLPPQDVMFDSNIVEIIIPYIEFLTKKFPKQFEKIWKNGHKNPIARQIIYRGGFNIKKVPEEFVQIYMKRIGELPPDIFLQLFSEMKNHQILNFLESIKIPSLIIGGDKDQVIPNYLQHILHDHLKNSEIYILKDGSHVPQADFPENTNERIDHFIKKNTNL